MWKRINPYFSRTSWHKSRWDQFLPFVFLAMLFLFLLWQIHSIFTLTIWAKQNITYILDLRSAEYSTLEMNSNLRGFYVTGSLESIEKYKKSDDKFDDLLDDLERLPPNLNAKLELEKIRQNYALWDKFALEVITAKSHVINLEKLNHLSAIQKSLNRIIDDQIKLRDERRSKFISNEIQWFLWSNIVMLLLTSLYVVHFLRARKNVKALEKSESYCKGMLDQVNEAEERFKGLMESAHDLILIVNHSGQIIYVNYSLAETFGYLKEELMGETVEILVPDRYRELHVLQRNRFMENPTSRFATAIDLTGKRKDGTEMPLEIVLSPAVIKGKLQVAAIVRDISQRINHERRQKWLVELADITSSTLDGLVIKSLFAQYTLGKFCDWSVVITSKCECAVFEKGKKIEEVEWNLREELAGKVLKIMRNKKYHVKQNVSQDDVNALPLSIEQKKRVNSRGVKSVAMFPLSSRNEKFGAIIFVNEKNNYSMSDIDFMNELVSRICLSLENARLYQVSQESISMRDELLRIVSHDLKNPLNSIMLNAQVVERLLKKDNQANEVAMGRVNALERNADHAMKLIKDLLDNAKIETGGLKLDKAAINPQTLIEETRHLFESLAEEKSVEFTAVSNLKRPLSIFADHERVLQVISNLLGNSIKYTQQGGHVKVCLEDRGKELEFTVVDDGPGISQEKQGHLFEKYWRDTETGLMNLGLGLSIAKGVVEAHGGRIWYESAEGHGTKFTFTLPYLDAPESGHYELGKH